MKFLIVDHHFWQDIEALRCAAKGHEIRVVSANVLSTVARKYFPSSVFDSLLGEDYALPLYADARQRYAVDARKILHQLYLTFPFDAVIVPSDTIFYLRAWVSCAHEMGIPFIVLQKETAISPYTMTEDARVIGQSLPFISDLILVCSEHHKQFWLNIGADVNKIIVTGQPRFDFYRQTDRWRTLESLGLHVPQIRPTILFFSYDTGAYSPEGVLAPTWTQLRNETEEVLIDVAHRGIHNVLIKPHPQQQEIRVYKDRLKSMAGPMWGESVQLIPSEFDTRQLIVNTQVIVGFQTTAMFEAMAAGGKVVYTFWSEAPIRFTNALIPFHEMEDVLCIARSPQELKNLLFADQDFIVSDELVSRRLREAEKQLGPLDGRAAERCMRQIEECIAKYAGRMEVDARALCSKLNALRPAYCKSILWKARLEVVFLRIIECLLPFVYPLWLIVRLFRRSRRGPAGRYGEYRRDLVKRRHIAFETMMYCHTLLAQRDYTRRQGSIL